MHLELAVLSRSGDRPSNEDACGYWRESGPLCCVLSDGAGGHAAGEVASQLAVSSTLQTFAADPAIDSAHVAGLIDQANRQVVSARTRSARPDSDMRATLVVLTIDPATRRANWGHVGDSRLYWLRAGRIAFRTRDHSLFQSMLDAGFVTERARADHPDRSVLTAAVGSTDECVPDVADAPVALRAGDAFLLCSDGLWGVVHDEIVTTLQRAASPTEWLDQLAAVVQARAQPGQDNYSALAVWCDD